MADSNQLKQHLSKPRIAELRKNVIERFSQSHLFAHGMNHINRDLVNAHIIAETEECDMDIVFTSILLHDIGFLYPGDPYKHNEIGAEHCAEWLNDSWAEKEKKEIRECVFRHKGVMESWNTKPETIEQKIVCDADLLEKVGYIGLVQGIRVFSEFGEHGSPEFKNLTDIIDVLKGIKEVQFYTEKGKAMAAERDGIEVRLSVIKKTSEEMEIYAPFRELLKEI
jgi:HD superfamily phosphodiesterase